MQPVIITDLIIERQMEKIKSRKEYTRPDDDINEEDKCNTRINNTNYHE